MQSWGVAEHEKQEKAREREGKGNVIDSPKQRLLKIIGNKFERR